MSFDFDPDARLNQLGARWTVNLLQRSKDTPEFVERMAFDKLRTQLASVLARDAMRVTENVYSTDYEIRVYVLTSDQLEKYVQRRAQHIGYDRVSPASVIEQRFEPGESA